MRRLRFFVLAIIVPVILPGSFKAQYITDFHARLFAISSNDGLSQGFVPSIVQDHRGFIWFATKDGLNKYDGYTFTIYRHDEEDSNSIAENFVQDIFEDSRGYLWISMPDHLQVFDPLTEKFTAVRLSVNGKKYNTPNKMMESADGDIWCDGYGGLLRLHLDERNKNETVFAKKFSISQRFISEAGGVKLEPHTTRPFIDADNGFWIMKDDSVFYTPLEQAERSAATRYSMIEFTHLPPGRFLHAYTDTTRHRLITILSSGISVYIRRQKNQRMFFLPR